VALDRELLSSELRMLRKGRGLLERELPRRVGNQLADLCKITDRDDTALIRERLGSTVVNLARDLPPDLRLAVAAALAIDPGVQHRFLNERVSWLAGQLHCDGRTARRRIDHGFDLLVESALRQHGTGQSDVSKQRQDEYEVELFRAILNLDTPTPELREERTIVATADDVAEVVVPLSLPRMSPDASAPHDVFASVVHGGRIVAREEPADNHFRFTVEFPRPLHKGETHKYDVAFRLPAGQVMSPHYAVVPFRTCQAFELIVRFALDGLPRSAWLLDGVFPRLIDSRRPNDRPLTPDPVGEIHLRFENPRRGLGYGLAWAP
jgi:hypothetical protein